MATLWDFSRNQARDINGAAYPGAKAFFFDANTSTPRVVYQDNAATVPHSQPVLADANGRFPAVYLPSGLYRERVTTAGNVLLWDFVEVDATPVVAAGGGGGSVDPTTILATGDFKWRYGTGTLAGFVRANGRSIGNPSSGATERANADAQALFEFLWTADANLAVSGGRGATASADWSANKALTLPDFRARTIGGLAGMGNTAIAIDASVPISGGTADELGRILGAQAHTLTTPQIPSHTHTATVTDPGHVHGLSGGTTVTGVPGGGATSVTGRVGENTFTATTGISVSNANTGGGGAHPNYQPTVLGTFYIKL